MLFDGYYSTENGNHCRISIGINSPLLLDNAFIFVEFIEESMHEIEFWILSIDFKQKKRRLLSWEIAFTEQSEIILLNGLSRLIFHFLFISPIWQGWGIVPRMSVHDLHIVEAESLPQECCTRVAAVNIIRIISAIWLAQIASAWQYHSFHASRSQHA